MFLMSNFFKLYCKDEDTFNVILFSPKYILRNALVNSTHSFKNGMQKPRDPASVRIYMHKEEYPPVSNWLGFE